MAGSQGRSGSGKVPPRPGGRRPPARQARPAPKTGRAVPRTSVRRVMQQRRQRNIYMAAGAVAVVVAVIAVIVAIKLSQGGPSTATTTPGSDTGEFALPATVVPQVTGVPVRTLASAAEKYGHQDSTPPQALHCTKPLTSGGKPEIFYMGAEYCPFCAAERWPLVMALSKFGTFSHLRGTSSGSQDVNANTPTFSFYGSTYTSRYISFVPVETQTNVYYASITSGAPYKYLQTPPKQQIDLLKYDAQPYTSASQAGSIAFVYFAGRYVVGGAQYVADHIAGWPITLAAPYMTAGNNPTSQGAEAAAGYLVGDICALTHKQPARVCSAVPAGLIGITTSSPSGKGGSSAGAVTTTTASSATSTTSAATTTTKPPKPTTTAKKG